MLSKGYLEFRARYRALFILDPYKAFLYWVEWWTKDQKRDTHFSMLTLAFVYGNDPMIEELQKTATAGIICQSMNYEPPRRKPRADAFVEE